MVSSVSAKRAKWLAELEGLSIAMTFLTRFGEISFFRLFMRGMVGTFCHAKLLFLSSKDIVVKQQKCSRLSICIYIFGGRFYAVRNSCCGCCFDAVIRVQFVRLLD